MTSQKMTEKNKQNQKMQKTRMKMKMRHSRHSQMIYSTSSSYHMHTSSNLTMTQTSSMWPTKMLSHVHPLFDSQWQNLRQDVTQWHRWSSFAKMSSRTQSLAQSTHSCSILPILTETTIATNLMIQYFFISKNDKSDVLNVNLNASPKKLLIFSWRIFSLNNNFYMTFYKHLAILKILNQVCVLLIKE